MYGCDDCQEVCPVNRVAARTAGLGRPGPEPGARDTGAGEDGAGEAGSDEAAVDILDVLATPDAALLAAFGRWYIPQRDPRYLRRNALIVLGNVGDGRHPGVERALRRYLAGPDEMLRAHAVWAAVRTGRRDLVDEAGGLRDDPSPMVQDELRRTGAIEARAAGATDPGSDKKDK
jgi:epoxyqueuosine reductase